MAVTIQTLNDGARNHVVHLNIAGANTAATVVDASAWSRAADFTKCKVDKISWSLTGAGAQLLWDATADVTFFECTAGEGEQDFSRFGGLQNNAGAGITGDINLTNAAGVTSGTITLWCKKKA